MQLKLTLSTRRTLVVFGVALVASLFATGGTQAQVLEFDFCSDDVCDVGTNTCVLTGGACTVNADCPGFATGDVCTLDQDSCDGGFCSNNPGRACTTDDECRFCSLSFAPCHSDADCAASAGQSVCTVSRNFCTTDADCRPTEAVSNGCINDVYNLFGQGGNLTCTANDIQISETSILTVIDACDFPGDFATVQLQADFVLTAQDRQDVGVYLGLGGVTALTGDCLIEIVPELPEGSLPGGAGDPADLDSFCNPSGECKESLIKPSCFSGICNNSAGTTCTIDADCEIACDNNNNDDYDDCAFIDTCGDISNRNSYDGTIVDVPLSPITLPCIDNNGDGQADLPSCLSWRQDGANEVCLSPIDAYPGAPSKCRCEILDIPLRVPKSLEVVKDLIPDDDGGLFDLKVDGTIEAGAVGDGGTTGRLDVSDGFCSVTTTQACSSAADCPEDEFCDPSDRTVSEDGFGTTDLADYYSTIECVSRLGSCSGDSTIACSLDPNVTVDPCVNLDIGTCVGDPVTIGSCDDCTEIPVEIINEPTDILCTITNYPVEINLTKECDDLSKVGDDIDYTITLENLSGPGAPDLDCTVDDDFLTGDFPQTVTLSPGDTETYNVSYTVQAGDPDPIPNTADASCDVVGSDPVRTLTATDSCNASLFQPSIAVDKAGDALAKVGDTVIYTITLSNNSSADTPALTCTATDTLLGEVFNGVLSAGDTVLNPTHVVTGADPDPLVNTVTLSCSPEGYPNVLEASESHSTDLFQASITFDKTGDLVSKVGDGVSYTITLNNTSSAGTPDLVCDITDEKLGIDKTVTLASGGSNVTNATYTVLAADSDPLLNTADVSCSPVGYTNTLTGRDGHSVDLFQPSITLDKTGDALSKVGDDVAYTITLNNTSSTDTPDLVCDITDTKLGIDKTVTVASGGSNVTNATYTVLAADSDPLVNTANVSCSPVGWPNTLTASDGHSVNLFQPSITLDKTGDAYGKVGDDVAYTITLNNTSSTDTPDLVCDITDTKLGIDKTVTVASDGSNVTNATYTVLAGDPDPLLNTANVSCSPTGYPNILTASDGHSVDLFQASITFNKTGDATSKVGDDVAYTITLNNTSSTDTPDLVCDITDTKLGIDKTVTVASDGSNVTNATYTVLAGDPDPLLNTANVSCSPTGYPNILTASDGHSVDLFQPAVAVTKTGDPLSKVGDDVFYTITLSNNSSADSPALTCTATDTLLGVVFGPDANLPAGDTVLTPSRTVAAGDPDPLVNTVTLSCTLAGFPNTFSVTNSHSTDLVAPSYTVAKTCTNEPIPLGGPATFNVRFTNTGDVLLTIYADDGVGTFALPVGQSRDFPVSTAGPFDGIPSVSNTVTSEATVAGLPNVIPGTSSATCVVAGGAGVIKLTQGLPNEAPNLATTTWNFLLQDCGTDGCSFGDPIISDVTSPPSSVTFPVSLVPVQYSANQTYRVCEVLIPAAWTNTWMGDIDDNGTPETAIPFVAAVNDDPVVSPPGWSRVFDPAYSPPPAQWTNDERCVNFAVDAGATEVFQIDNQFPGGEPRTIGYWKNWDSCSGGGQVDTAIDLGGETPAERLASGHALLDDVLQPPGITIGLLNMQADTDVFDCDEGTENARLILDKRDIGRGKKKASDAAYGLAAQLLAAIANDTAGAGVCSAAGQAIVDGQNLLVGIEFIGTGNYFNKRTTEINGFTKQQANNLAGTLDLYNNGILCAP